MRYWQKYRHINRWNRIEVSETDPHEDGKLIFDKSNNNSVEKEFFSTNGIWTTEHYRQKHELQPQLYKLYKN